MKKLKIYLDTSVISHLKADDVPEKMESTRKMWVEMVDGIYKVFISRLVIAEIDDCPEPKRTELFQFLSTLKYSEILVDDETYQLAQEYIRHGIIPAKYEDDALIFLRPALMLAKSLCHGILNTWLEPKLFSA